MLEWCSRRRGDLCHELQRGAILVVVFSGRRRHTRLQGDWSSDVCSSDLLSIGPRSAPPTQVMQNDDSPQPLALTPRKAIEQVCMRNLLASSKERLFFKDLEGRFVLVSAGFAEALGAGRSVEEVIGKSDFDLFSRPQAGEAFADEQNIIDTGDPMIGKVELETYHDRPDIWVATSKWPLRDEGGNIIGTFGI